MAFSCRVTSNSTHRNVLVTLRSRFVAMVSMKTLADSSRFNASLMRTRETRTRAYESKINKYLVLFL